MVIIVLLAHFGTVQVYSLLISCQHFCPSFQINKYFICFFSLKKKKNQIKDPNETCAALLPSPLSSFSLSSCV